MGDFLSASLRFSIALLLIFVAGVEVYMLWLGSLTLADAWFSLLLTAIGTALVIFRSRRDASLVVAVLLGSLSVLVSSVAAEELFLLPGILGSVAFFVWLSLLWLLPFVLVHFSLVFPAPSPLVGRKRQRIAWLYVVFAFGIGTEFLGLAGSFAGEFFLVLAIPFGLVAALGILLWQYVHVLTLAERNRLRVIIAGCSMGTLPLLFSAVAGETQPELAQNLANLLLPLFPLSLVFAVSKENFTELDRFSQKLVVVTFVLAGVVVATFLITFTLAWAFGQFQDDRTFLLVLSGAILLSFPMTRIVSSYVKLRFGFSSTSIPSEISLHGEFHPIHPNPFIVGNPVRNPRMFFGREEDFRFIRHVLRNRGPVAVVTGERRTGKTSILYQILQGRLGEEYSPLFLDMQGVIVENDREFLLLLGEKLLSLLPEGEGRFDSTRTERSAFSDFHDFVAEVLSRLEDRKALLLIDEYELIDRLIETGRLSSEFPQYLNSLLEEYPSLRLVLTGSQPLEARPVWGPIMEKSVYREISFLHPADARELLRGPLDGQALFRLQVLDEIQRLTCGHPFFTQLVGQTAVDVLNDRETFLVDRSVLREVIARITENPPPHLLYQWDAFDDFEKLILATMGSRLASNSEYVSVSEVQQLLRKMLEGSAISLGDSDVGMTLENLRSKRVVDRDQTRYRFTMDLFRLWISQEVSVWSVIGQLKERSVPLSTPA